MATAVHVNVERFLGELCVKLGLCSSARHIDAFVSLIPQGVDAFTDEVLRVEGRDPLVEKQLRRTVRAEVASRFALWQSEPSFE